MAVVLAAAMAFGVPVAVGQNTKVAKAAVDNNLLIYENDFSTNEETKGSIIGSGTIESEDGEHGGVFQNIGTAQRTNYFKLPETVFSGNSDLIGENAGITISFDVRSTTAEPPKYAPMFSAYSKAPESNENGTPMFIIQGRGLIQLNANGWDDFAAAETTTGTLVESVDYLNDQTWHTVTVTVSSSNAAFYVDGVAVNVWDNPVNDYSGFFSSAGIGQLTYICLGGNQAWNWGDNDSPYRYDNVKIYATALSASDVSVLINGVDYSGLNEAISNAENLYQADYTSSDAFTTALNNAKAALDSTDQDVIDDRAAVLKTATSAAKLTSEDNNLSFGLIGCYDFNNNVKDLISKNSASKVTVASTTLSDNENTEFQYDGGVQLGDYGLKLPTTIQNVTNYTISVNAKFGSDSLTGYDNSIYSIQALGAAVGAPREVLFTGWNAAYPMYLSEINSTKNEWNWAGTSSSALVADTEYNIILRKEDNKTTMYIDGTSVATATCAESKNLSTALNFFIGANSWKTVDMNISDCEIYDRCLSAPEISALSGKNAEEIYVDYIRSNEETDNFYNISSYRGETYTYPEVSGKAFAGWFTDSEFTTPLDAETTTGYAYAKFVDEKLLATKAQSCKVETTKTSDFSDAVFNAGTYKLRLLLGVDSVDYTDTGFIVTYKPTSESEEKDLATLHSSDVYNNVVADDKTYAANEIFSSAEYIKPALIYNISQSMIDDGITFMATPYWVTLDGTTVKGSVKTISAEDIVNNLSENKDSE